MGKNLIINQNMYGQDMEKSEMSPVYMEHCFYRESGNIFLPHWHEQLELMYLEQGRAVLLCGEQKIFAEQNTIIIVNPNEIHSGENTDSDLEYYLLKIDLLLLLGNQPDLQQAMYTELLLKNRLLFENRILSNDFILYRIKEIVREFLEKKEGYELALRGLSYQLLTALLRGYTKTVPNQLELDIQYRRLMQIKPATTYMEKHLTEKITLDDLSKTTHLSPIHFSRVFKTVSGLPPMEFLNRMRVQKATQLLLQTDKTIAEIAMDSGFNDSNYFSRFFKKCRNETPSEFRQKYIR